MWQSIDFSRFICVIIDFAKIETLFIWAWCKLKRFLIYHKQARVFEPLMFIEHEPQMPSRHDLLNVSVGSCSFLILIRASRTIVPHLSEKKCANVASSLGVNILKWFTCSGRLKIPSSVVFVLGFQDPLIRSYLS